MGKWENCSNWDRTVEKCNNEECESCGDYIHYDLGIEKNVPHGHLEGSEADYITSENLQALLKNG